MSEVKNVATGKPKIGGAVSVAPVGTELPTDTTAELNEAFKNLGYISDAGLSNDGSRESETIVAWGGDIVATPQTSKNDTFTFNLIEVLNVDVLKTVFGDGNVSGTLEDGITVKVNSTPLEHHAFTVDMIVNEAVKRIVIPDAVITTIEAITYADNSITGYNCTINAFPDATGNTHYEYIKGQAAPVI